MDKRRAEMLCPSCHTLNRDNARFCKKCGMSFPSESVETSPPEAAGPLKEGDPTGPGGATTPSAGIKVAPAETNVASTPDAHPAESASAASIPSAPAESPEVAGSTAVGSPSFRPPLPADAKGPVPSPGAADVEPAPSPKAEPTHEIEDADDDVSLIPTQILTPDQMIAYHARRWQEEVEREQHEAA